LSDSVQDLTDSYNELSAAGENTTDVLAEMDEQIPKLISSYRELIKTLGATDSSKLEGLVDELEEAYNLAKLTGDYSDFSKKQQEVDNEITRIEYENAKSGGAAAATLAGYKMTEESKNGTSKMKGSTMQMKFAGSDATWRVWDGNGERDLEKFEETKAQNILKDTMGDYYKKGHESSWFTRTASTLEVDTSDPLAFVDYYEKLQQAKNEMMATMTEEQRQNSGIFEDVNKALADGAEYYE
jgi:hypothetical protein